MRKEPRERELRKSMRQEIDRLSPVSCHDIEELNHKMDALAVQVEELAGKE